MGGQHHAPAALPPGKTRYPLYRRLGGPQGRSGRVRKTNALVLTVFTKDAKVCFHRFECISEPQGIRKYVYSFAFPGMCRIVVAASVRCQISSCCLSLFQSTDLFRWLGDRVTAVATKPACFFPCYDVGRASEETCVCITGYSGPIVWEIKYYKESRRRGISYKERKEGQLTVLVTSCVGTDLLKQVIEGKIEGSIEVTARWGRWRKKLLDDLKEKRGHRKLKEEALDRTQ
jgi:hypothetical protein